jgi:hypothetical protein
MKVRGSIEAGEQGRRCHIAAVATAAGKTLEAAGSAQQASKRLAATSNTLQALVNRFKLDGAAVKREVAPAAAAVLRARTV